MLKPLIWIWRRLQDVREYVDYRVRRRARIKKARKEDPNIYPLW
jgi:hypothetical protein